MNQEIETCRGNISSLQSSFRNVTPNKKDDFHSKTTPNKTKSITKIQTTSSLNKKCSTQKIESRVATPHLKLITPINKNSMSIEETANTDQISSSIKKNLITECPKQFNISEINANSTETVDENQNIEHVALEKIQLINTNTANFSVLEENQNHEEVTLHHPHHQDSLSENNRQAVDYSKINQAGSHETKILDQQAIIVEGTPSLSPQIEASDSKINLFKQDSLWEETNTFGFQPRAHTTPSDPSLSPEKEKNIFTLPKTNQKSSFKHESASQCYSANQFQSALALKSNVRLSFSHNSQNTPNGFGTEAKSEASDLLSHLENQSLLNRAMNFADIDANMTFLRNNEEAQDLPNNFNNIPNTGNQIDQITELQINHIVHPLMDQIAHPLMNQTDHPLMDQIDHPLLDQTDHILMNKTDDPLIDQTTDYNIIKPEFIAEKFNMEEQYDKSVINNGDSIVIEVIQQHEYTKSLEDLSNHKGEHLNTSNMMQIEEEDVGTKIVGSSQSDELIIANDEDKFEESANKKENIINLEDLKYSTPGNEGLSGSRLDSNKSSKVTKFHLKIFNKKFIEYK